MELPLDQRLNSRQDIAVDVVEKIEGGEQCKCKQRSRGALHLQERSLEPAAGRAQRASTVVPTPPRGRKTPRTTAHSGSAALTISPTTGFTMVSGNIPSSRSLPIYSFSDVNSSR